MQKLTNCILTIVATQHIENHRMSQRWTPFTGELDREFAACEPLGIAKIKNQYQFDIAYSVLAHTCSSCLWDWCECYRACHVLGKVPIQLCWYSWFIRCSLSTQVAKSLFNLIAQWHPPDEMSECHFQQLWSSPPPAWLSDPKLGASSSGSQTLPNRMPEGLGFLGVTNLML